MDYILQLLMENDQFESLLHTGLEKVHNFLNLLIESLDTHTHSTSCCVHTPPSHHKLISALAPLVHTSFSCLYKENLPQYSLWTQSPLRSCCVLVVLLCVGGAAASCTDGLPPDTPSQ